MKAIAKNKINTLLEALMGKYQVFAPVAEDESTVNFAPMEKAEQATLDFYNSKEPVKKLFFPQCQTLFCYQAGQNQCKEQPKSEKPRVLFGVRPCDARSLALLDMVFDANDYKDPYYLTNRNNTTIFALACARPQSSCFCTSLEIGPFSKEGADVMVVDMGDKYVFEAATEAGERILGELGMLTHAEPADAQRVKDLAAEAEKKVTRKVDLQDVSAKLATAIDDPIWDEIQEKCLGCAVCTFMCPTCHCFDMVDEQNKESGRRVRIWDSCMRSDFTREASGHNPRGTGTKKTQQRIMHKFNYFPENNGQIACVGCGRCLRNCPAGSDLTAIITRISNLK